MECNEERIKKMESLDRNMKKGEKLIEGVDFWIEYFDKCERCEKQVGQGIECYTNGEKIETMHLCDECFKKLREDREK